MAIQTDFRALTSFAPLSWQTRLYRKYLGSGNIPLAVDVPTGVGKTSVIALWLIAASPHNGCQRGLNITGLPDLICVRSSGSSLTPKHRSFEFSCVGVVII